MISRWHSSYPKILSSHNRGSVVDRPFSNTFLDLKYNLTSNFKVTLLRLANFYSFSKSQLKDYLPWETSPTWQIYYSQALAFLWYPDPIWYPVLFMLIACSVHDLPQLPAPRAKTVSHWISAEILPHTHWFQQTLSRCWMSHKCLLNEWMDGWMDGWMNERNSLVTGRSHFEVLLSPHTMKGLSDVNPYFNILWVSFYMVFRT